MKCCICNKEIQEYSYNPFPLCYKEDKISKCCADCTNKVSEAQKIIHKHPLIDEYLVNGELMVDVGDTIMIFYANNSNEPINAINDGIFLLGTIDSIDLEYGLIFGDWGAFAIDLEKDTYCKINE
ncbi:MAG: hypothetical protein VZS44_07995 [Bacilli bacterium]|nr:hypothetical protein [Bacilli bacterium]